MSEVRESVGRMDHELDELRVEEDAHGVFVLWLCACGKTGRGPTQQTAHTGWRSHVERSERFTCRIVPPSPSR